MADTMQFDLVSPEALLLSGQATQVEIPGAEGDLTAMPNHAPVITTLRPGLVRAEMEGGVQEFAVLGGFAEITGDGASVLAEHAVAKGDLTRDAIAPHLERARAAAETAEGGDQDVAAKRVADLTALEALATG
ncbi:MAG: F0F1 ATP synthase subunit epsilon [Pseudomonadota bacterium]